MQEEWCNIICLTCVSSVHEPTGFLEVVMHANSLANRITCYSDMCDVAGGNIIIGPFTFESDSVIHHMPLNYWNTYQSYV